MAGLINDSVRLKLDELVTKLFLGNRIADRGMSQLDVKFAMNKTVKNLHPKLAHRLSAEADKVSDFMGDRNVLTVYGATPLDDSEYNSPIDFFTKMLDYCVELENLCCEVRDTAEENNDYTTRAFIDSFLLGFIPITKQCLLLIDKANAYKEDYQSFDHRIEDWIIL